MDRINGAGHVNHQFVAEDAQNNRPPTEITAEWLNGVQEEICNVILAGGITLDPGNSAQLLAALRAGGLFRQKTAGYNVLPDGRIEQWGAFISSVSGDIAVTFPIQFPNSCHAITFGTSTSSGSGAYGTVSGNPTLSGFLGASYSDRFTRVSTTVYYRAIGE